MLDKRQWRSEPGPIFITFTSPPSTLTHSPRRGRLDHAPLPGEGIHVAEVVEDIDAAVTGGVEVFPDGMGVKVRSTHR